MSALRDIFISVFLEFGVWMNPLLKKYLAASILSFGTKKKKLAPIFVVAPCEALEKAQLPN